MRDRDRNNFHLPYNPDLVAKARELRKNMTPAERKLWYDYLKTFKFRVLRQRPIAFFIVDFYCAALKLVIEVDGNSHFTEAGRAYDAERTRILEGYGLKVIRFTNDEVLHNFDTVCDRIEEEIPLNPRVLILYRLSRKYFMLFFCLESNSPRRFQSQSSNTNLA